MERQDGDLSGETLYPLLEYLVNTAPVLTGRWQQWSIAPWSGGANNLLYRATCAETDLAIKFTVRDWRDRAGREYTALSLLRDHGLNLAPLPVLLDRERYPQPVVVSTWIAGTAVAQPPTTDADWLALLQHFLALHQLTPDQVTAPAQPVVLTMLTPLDGLQRINELFAGIPKSECGSAICALVQQANQAQWPCWSPPAAAFCRGDPNISNFLQRPNV